MTKARNLANLLSTSNGKIAGSNLDVSFENISDTGTEGTKVASGTSAQRGSTVGQFRFNTTTGKFEGKNASSFISLDVAPTISSVNNNNITQTQIDAGFDLVITGENFASGDSVKFIGSDGTEYTSPTVTVNSTTQITARVTSNIDGAKEPFLVKIINTGNFSGQLSSAFNINSSPAFATASGSLGTVFEDSAISGSLNAGATDPEGSSVTHSISSGALPTGLSMASSTGLITGTPNVNDSYSAGVTHNFTVSATDGTNTSARAFSILRKFSDGSSSTQFATSASAIKTLTGTTTDGYYYIKASGMANPVRLWCDMNTDSGGYMRFWWFNTLEQDGALNGAWQTGTKFGTADISTIPYNQYYGYGRIPSGVTPTKLMVKGTSSDQTTTNPPRHMIYTIDTNNSTSNNMLQSMQSGTTFSMAQGDNFPASSGSLDAHYSNFQQAGMSDHWGYNTNNILGGSANESTFDLNDDTGRDNTSFSAGHDGGASGTDFFQMGSPVDNATGRYLIIYWK
tara:strand:+ start:314 stop:1849 length:1536 start_codon:yes stop_codon:yes gene_type:complete